MKKLYRLVTSLLVFFITLSCSSYYKNNNQNIINNSISSNVVVSNDIEDIVDESLSDVNIRIDDYVDVDFFKNLDYFNDDSSIKYSLNDIDDIQYDALSSSLDKIYSELNEEEIDIIKEYSKDDEDISNMLSLLENKNFNEVDKKDNIIKLALAGVAVLSVSSVLASASVSNAAIISINGAFKTMLATIKAFFVPTYIKVVLITTSLLILTTVIVINWNKIKRVFNTIVDIFKTNAGRFASTVVKVFNNIFNTVKTTVLKDINDTLSKHKDLSNRLNDIKKEKSDVESCLKDFLAVDSLDKFYNSNDKVLCIGRDLGEDDSIDSLNSILRYNVYASSYGYFRFYVKDFKEMVERYTYNLITLANDILIYYCVDNDWDFILVTNPYHYMEERTSRYGFKHFGQSYANEIKIIRNNNYNNFISPNYLTWSKIRNPGYREIDYYAFAGYRVSR